MKVCVNLSGGNDKRWKEVFPFPSIHHQASHNPTFGGVWGWHSHPQNGDLGVIRDSQNFRAWLQGSPWNVFHIVGKLMKCRCRKWPRIGRLDICSTSYGKKKGRESNCQFDSRPLKVGNRPDPEVCRRSVIHHWKVLEESYNFALDCISIRGLSKELWRRKFPRVQTRTVSGLHLGSPRTKSHSGVGAVE
jgi:hypothetical protein